MCAILLAMVYLQRVQKNGKGVQEGRETEGIGRPREREREIEREIERERERARAREGLPY